jgi:hypothetical protein
VEEFQQSFFNTEKEIKEGERYTGCGLRVEPDRIIDVKRIEAMGSLKPRGKHEENCWVLFFDSVEPFRNGDSRMESGSSLTARRLPLRIPGRACADARFSVI